MNKPLVICTRTFTDVVVGVVEFLSQSFDLNCFKPHTFLKRSRWNSDSSHTLALKVPRASYTVLIFSYSSLGTHETCKFQTSFPSYSSHRQEIKQCILSTLLRILRAMYGRYIESSGKEYGESLSAT